MSAEISTNRKALHDYIVESKIEAGIELLGTEVKSIRAGHVNLRGSYARIENGQAWLFDMDVQPYAQASHEQHVPKRKRRLLLHKREIDQLFGEANVSGRTLVPLRLYWKSGRVKVEIGVGKGKHDVDKRSALKNREETREAARTAANFNRR
ncbi:MAG TPA: SsrA-binding protein SmpB [Chthoniobacterales bacterium]|jgi:SsrA-binding protein|nr:SsrA-binding protein SmpB [Chthoniobacterales bacterium]